MNQTIQLIQTTPEQLAQLINEGIKTQLAEFSKQFTPSNPDILLTREQTCELLHIDQSTLYHWTKNGKLTAHGIANRRYYKKSEVLSSLHPLKV